MMAKRALWFRSDCWGLFEQHPSATTDVDTWQCPKIWRQLRTWRCSRRCRCGRSAGSRSPATIDTFEHAVRTEGAVGTGAHLVVAQLR